MSRTAKANFKIVSVHWDSPETPEERLSLLKCLYGIFDERELVKHIRDKAQAMKEGKNSDERRSE